MTRLPWILFFLTLSWALTVSWLHLSPRWIAKKPILDDGAISAETRALEKTNFIRRFVNQYFSYDSGNFWQSQTNLVSLMSPDLREIRLSEVQRLRDKIGSKEFSQQAFIGNIKVDEDNRYFVETQIELAQSGSKDDLFSKISVSIQEIPRTVENPWGLLVKEIDVQEMRGKPDAPRSSLSLGTLSPLTIAFPCSIQRFEIPPESPLKIKIITMGTSEVQISSQFPLEREIGALAFCNEIFFPISIRAKENVSDIFAAMTLDVSKRTPRSQRKKTDEEKRIEKEFNFTIED